MWESNAQIIEEVYGGFVDWGNHFYICPECGEPVYESDYRGLEFLCPVCEFDDRGE